MEFQTAADDQHEKCALACASAERTTEKGSFSDSEGSLFVWFVSCPHCQEVLSMLVISFDRWSARTLFFRLDTRSPHVTQGRKGKQSTPKHPGRRPQQRSGSIFSMRCVYYWPSV